MSIVIKNITETLFSFDDVVSLMHKAFEERLEQGLKFTCSNMSVEEYKNRLKSGGGVTLVAYDDENNFLYGTAMLHIYKDKRGNKYAYNENLAVVPYAKRKGIGTLLLKVIEEIAITNNCDYIGSDTSIGAKSSVKWHLKNGFKIVGYKSYNTTNNYSYLFRKQLVTSKIYDNDFLCKLIFLKSYLMIRLLKKEDGNYTRVGALISSLIHK